MQFEAVNLREKLSKFSERWKPKIIAQMNDYHFKVAKIQGAFVWHKHDDTDEVFIVLEGELELAFKEGSVPLKSGELFVVPKGMEHKPIARKECSILLVEPAGTLNTGDAGGEMTVTDDVWI